MKDKIAVLAGGTSCEREISLISGKAVFEALLAQGYPVIMVDPAYDFIDRLKSENVSMAFLALHGTFGEDGTIQRILEREGICYTGPGPSASQTAFDKAAAQTLFQSKGVLVPDFKVLFSQSEITENAPFEFPLVVKPAKAGSSVGVSILKDSAGYQKACETAFLYSDTILVEKFILGRELTVGILGDQALPVVEVIAGRDFYDYQAKYKDAGTRYEFPAKLTESQRILVERAALDAYHALEAQVMSRVDIILSKDQGLAYVLEVNTIPGLTSKSLLPKAAQAAGISFSELCDKIMALSKKRTYPVYGKTS